MIQAGFARLDVTPPLGTPLAGYFCVRHAKGVISPIELNALAFGNGKDTALLIAADFTGMTMARITPLRARIAAVTGLPAEHIMITSLHQHTSVYVGDKIGDAEDYAIIEDAAYLDLLYRKLCDVAKMAVDDMSEACLGTAEGQTAQPLAFVRRYVLEDGSIATNPSSKGAHPVRRCDPDDNTVRLCRFTREGKRDIALVNFSTHPDVVTGSRISADWPGYVRQNVEAALDGVSCICTVGCQGDSNHMDFFKPKEERLFGGNGPTHSAYMGRVIADAVIGIWDRTAEHTGDAVFGGVETIYNKTNAEGEEDYDLCAAYIKAYEAGLPTPVLKGGIAYAMRAVRLRTAQIYRAVPVTVLGIGDVAFVGFGGEPFTHYATAARAAAPDKTVICACCANGYEGYLPTAKAFGEGGYEIDTSLFTPNLEQQCVGAAAEMLKKF